jgi:hypothetical protein
MRAIADENVRNLVVAHSRFIVHTKSGIIAYHPVGTRISASAFQSHFCRLIENAVNEVFFSAEILPINELEMFQEAMRRFDRIDRLSIYLHPSNPSNRIPWRRVDERLRAMNVDNYQEVYHGKAANGGLKLDADPFLRSKIVMAEDGYGHADAIGKRDGKVHKASTRNQPLSAQAPGDAVAAPLVIRALASAFSSVLRRFRE